MTSKGKLVISYVTFIKLEDFFMKFNTPNTLDSLVNRGCMKFQGVTLMLPQGIKVQDIEIWKSA